MTDEQIDQFVTSNPKDLESLQLLRLPELKFKPAAEKTIKQIQRRIK